MSEYTIRKAHKLVTALAEEQAQFARNAREIMRTASKPLLPCPVGETDRPVAADFHGIPSCNNQKEKQIMKYANGREAKIGDEILIATKAGAPFVGVLVRTQIKGDDGIGAVVPLPHGEHYVELGKCVHVEDLAVTAAEADPAPAPVTDKPADVVPAATEGAPA